MLRNSPQVYELLVHADRSSSFGHDEDPVGGGFKRGRKGRERAAQLLLRPLASHQSLPCPPESISHFLRYGFHGVLEQRPVVVRLLVRLLHCGHEGTQLSRQGFQRSETSAKLAGQQLVHGLSVPRM